MKITQIGEYTGNIITTCLRNRGLENIDLLLNPDDSEQLVPSKLKNMDEAAKWTIAHAAAGSVIGIIVDPDADGYTSASLLYQYLMTINQEMNIVLFFHEGKTHGLTNDILAQVVEEDIDLLIIPDAGSNDAENIEQLYYSGVDVIVIDHHEVDTPPREGIIVNNQLEENEETNKNLVGVGMIYKFCEQLDTYFEEKHSHKFFDLIAIGQIGDVSDISENEIRYYTFKGLNNITNPFVKLVLEDHFGTTQNLAPLDFSFSIIPLINSVVRMGTMEDKYLLFRALNSIDADETWIVEKKKKNKETGKFDKFEVEQNLYEYAYDRFKKVKTKQANEVKAALKSFESLKPQGGIVLAILEDKFNPAVSGLIANKLAGKHKKPAIVIKKRLVDGEELLVGSGRGIDNDKSSFRDWCLSTNLTEFSQGHAGAFGIGLKEENLEPFIEKACDLDHEKEITYEVDYISTKVDKELIKEIVDNRILFGGKVKEPLIAFKGVNIRKEFIRQKGSMLTFYDNGLELVMFNAPHGLFESLTHNFDQYIKMDFVGTASKSEYSGKTKYRLVIDECSRSEEFDYETPESPIVIPKEEITVENIVF